MLENIVIPMLIVIGIIVVVGLPLALISYVKNKKRD